MKREQCAQRGVPFADHGELFRDLVDWVCHENIPGDFTFDSWFTHAANLNHIHRLGRNDVGDLKFNRKIIFRGQEMRAEELAAMIDPQDRKAVEIGDRQQWYFTRSVEIPDVDHPVRIAVIWDRRDSGVPRKILLTNRTHWEIRRILRVYRCRWRGTECFHRDGKQHLGMGDCQLRNGLGQTRHLYLVFLAHSALMRQLRQGRAHEWALERLMTIGQACRAVMRETLSQTIAWVIDRVQEGWSHGRIKAHLALA